MSVASYAVRQLNYTITLSQSGSTLTLPSGLRSEATIVNALTPETGSATIKIYGLSLSHMNQLSRAGFVWGAPAGNYDSIEIQAGDSVSGLSTVYVGKILEAYPDMNSQPSTPFVIKAQPGVDLQLTPVPPVSFTGSTPGATALASILSGNPNGATLENNGVTGVLSSPYFHGSTWDQALSCIRALGCFAYYDGVANVLAVWPKNGARDSSNPGGTVVNINPSTGLLGYPSFQQKLVAFGCSSTPPSARRSVASSICRAALPRRTANS